MTRIRGARGALLTAAATALVVTGLPAPASSQVTADAAADCPEAMPVSALTAGTPGHGLTVSSGTEPEPFTATVLGVLDDGIAPDLDMILAELDSPALSKAGGVWSGMSGSPVYAQDGRLIGAVSYGLALGPSKVAGITPAADMLALLDRAPVAAAEPAEAVRLPAKVRTELVRSGQLTGREADAGLRQLRHPLAISGLADDRLNKAVKRMKLTGVRAYRAGVAASAPSAADTIVPGGNLAAALSYGDLTAAAVGTATAVCGGEILGFGHPFLFSGASTMSAHGADAIFVQDDPTLTPFKVANIGAPIGTVDGDRMAGVHTRLGAVPNGTDVRSLVKAAGRSREGTTTINVDDYVPGISAFHLLANIDRVADRYGEGRSKLHWTIKGERADGTPWQLDRSNRYASQWDVNFESVFELWDQLWTIQDNSAEQVRVTDVDVSAAVDETYRAFRVGKVHLRTPDGWQKLARRSATRVEPGTTMK
ncbi:MAG: hypothetical protein M3467_10325, partial [Actinomycetota bacterium]|nr:hypothetical protein [Actinomycetota bacterium]